MKKLVVFAIFLAILMPTVAADDLIRIIKPFSIPNQIVLDKKPSHIYVVVFGGTYTTGSDRINPFTNDLATLATASYKIYGPGGGLIANGQLNFNSSISAYVAEISPSIISRPGAYRVVATVTADVDGDGQTETDTAESSFKAVFSHGAFIKLSEEGINALGPLAVKSVEASSVTFSMLERTIKLNPGQSMDISLAGVKATLIVDEIEEINGTRYASITLTYPKDLNMLSYLSLPVNLSTRYLTMDDLDRAFKYKNAHPIVVLSSSGDTYKARLSKHGAIEFSQLLESGFFGLIQVFQDFRIEPPSADVNWYVTMRAGISFANWAAAGFPLSLNEALDALIVWESEPHVQVNWKAEKWRQIVIFATKLAEKVKKYVDLITPDMIQESYFNFDIPGGFWAKLFAEHYDEGISAYVVAASWSIGDVEGIEFNWDEMWNALLNGEIIVSVDFKIKEVALEFKM